jgi:hypothetical protein
MDRTLHQGEMAIGPPQRLVTSVLSAASFEISQLCPSPLRAYVA